MTGCGSIALVTPCDTATFLRLFRRGVQHSHDTRRMPKYPANLRAVARRLSRNLRDDGLPANDDFLGEFFQWANWIGDGTAPTFVPAGGSGTTPYPRFSSGAVSDSASPVWPSSLVELPPMLQVRLTDLDVRVIVRHDHLSAVVCCCLPAS